MWIVTVWVTGIATVPYPHDGCASMTVMDITAMIMMTTSCRQEREKSAAEAEERDLRLAAQLSEALT